MRFVCKTCKVEFMSYDKGRQYCGESCAGLSPDNLAKAKAAASVPPKPSPVKLCPACHIKPRLTKYFKNCGDADCVKATTQKRGPALFCGPLAPNKKCEHCGGAYHSYTKTRKYCSYGCSCAAGTPTKAGQASARQIMKYGAKKDANHNEIFEELRKHCPVYDLSAAGCGVPDGIAWIDEAWQFFDVKNPKTGYGKRGLNPVQKKWVEKWSGGPVYLIYTQADAQAFGSGDLESVKVVQSAGSVVNSPEEALEIVGRVQP